LAASSLRQIAKPWKYGRVSRSDPARSARRASNTGVEGLRLGHAKVGGSNDVPCGLITELRQSCQESLAIRLELGGRKAGDVLEPDGAGSNAFHQRQSGRKHVALIRRSELFPGDAKGRARQA
jgi:hypothetical protein